jgi:arylsulfatase A-like enzyme
MQNEGTEFTRYTVSSPSCAPSRAALLSGQYGHNNGLIGNGRNEDGSWQAFKQLDIFNNNLATDLQKAGYRTIHIGKFINGYFGSTPETIATEIPPGWDEWLTLSSKGDANWNKFYFYGYYLNNQGRQEGPFGSIEYRRDSVRCSPISTLNCNHQTDLLTKRALGKLSGTRPFYMQLDYMTPHGDSVAPSGPEPSARHRGSAKKTPLPKNPQTQEINTRDKPSYVRSQPRLTTKDQSRLRERYTYTLESLRGVDDALGHITNQLKNLGQLDNTYIFFLSDNGMFFGEHSLIRSKYSHYQASSRVPLLVRGPGVGRGVTSSELVSNIDIAPTISEIAGGNLTGDGRSLLPFLADNKLRSQRPLILENFADKLTRSSFKDNYQGILTTNYKFINYLDGQTELYDFKNDPHELYNQARNPNYQKLISELKSALNIYKNCQGDVCRREMVINTTPKEFVSDAIAPPARFSDQTLYIYRNKIFTNLTCRKKTCLVTKKIQFANFSLSFKARVKRRQRFSITIPRNRISGVNSALWWGKPVLVTDYLGGKKTASYQATLKEN